MSDQQKTSFEPSRKIALLALAVLVISQFFPYEQEEDYQTTIGNSSGIGIVNAGGQAGGHSGWEIHSDALLVLSSNYGVVCLLIL